MADGFRLKRDTNPITVFDLPNDSNGDVRTRSVYLYSAGINFEVGSTISNSNDFVVVFLDSNDEITKESFIKLVLGIDTNASYFEQFKNVDECVDFITSLQYERVLLVLFLTEAEHLVPIIHDLSQLVSIYICTENEDIRFDPEWLNWINDFPIVRNKIYKINDELFNCLKDEIQSIRSDSVHPTMFSLTTKKTSSVKALNAEPASYHWSQALLNALRKLPQNDKSRQDILNECRMQYRNDTHELKRIEQFEKPYRPESAVWWYTQNCFLYKLINKALQTDNIDIIFKFRFFIIDLYNQLIDLHEKLKSDEPNILTVYRGQQIAANELEDLKLNINDIISLKSFLSTTKNKDVALIYAGNGSEQPVLESVVFEIIIDINRSQKPLADISKISQMPDEDEVLLSMSMLFRVKSVEKLYNNVWKVQLISIEEIDIESNNYFKHLKKADEYDEPLLNLGTLLAEMGSYDKAEKYLLMLLEEYTDKRPLVYNCLGLCHYAQHNYRYALHYYTLALNHFIASSCEMHPFCCYLYANIALIYDALEDYEEALKFYNRALKIHLKYPSRDLNQYASTLAHLGSLYENFGNLDEALKKYLQALNILESSSFKHKSRSGLLIYNCLGSLYLKLGKFDASMQYYRTALSTCQKINLSDHLSTGNIYLHIGGVHDFKGEYDEALESYEKAGQIFNKLDTIGRLGLAGVYTSMGVVYRKKKDYNLALHYQYKSLEIRKQYSSEDCASIASIYSNIGVIYYNMNIPEKSIEYLKKAIDSTLTCQTPNEMELARFYNNLGLSYADVGDSDQSFYYYNLSLNIKQRFFPANHRTFAITFGSIARTLKMKGDILMAIQYQEKALEIFQLVLNSDHPDLQTCMDELSFLKHLATQNT